ncbi:hypothetical protein [Bacillus sp. WP8]|nr:hypothetical protein [Bacillus sp. WP8]
MKGKGIRIGVVDRGCEREDGELKDEIMGGKKFRDDEDGDGENVKE